MTYIIDFSRTTNKLHIKFQYIQEAPNMTYSVLSFNDREHKHTYFQSALDDHRWIICRHPQPSLEIDYHLNNRDKVARSCNSPMKAQPKATLDYLLFQHPSIKPKQKSSNGPVITVH